MRKINIKSVYSDNIYVLVMFDNPIVFYGLIIIMLSLFIYVLNFFINRSFNTQLSECEKRLARKIDSLTISENRTNFDTKSHASIDIDGIIDSSNDANVKMIEQNRPEITRKTSRKTLARTKINPYQPLPVNTDKFATKNDVKSLEELI